ncbi:MAG TPA: methionine aminopeptidase [Pedococcus sp.]|nr:methionine aminopeptidase [Pedococcus sp.]
MAYWYNVETGKVETDETKGQADDLMGPYATEDEASRALDIARQKTERWDEADRAWEGEDD